MKRDVWITVRIWRMRKQKGWGSLQFAFLFWFIPATLVFDIYYDIKEGLSSTKHRNRF